MEHGEGDRVQASFGEAVSVSGGRGEHRGHFLETWEHHVVARDRVMSASLIFGPPHRVSCAC